MKKIMIWLFIPAFIQAQVCLNEVMFNPSGPESSDEFVEVLNFSADSVNLNGWQIGDGLDSDYLTDSGNGLLLAPNQYGLILDSDYFENSTAYDALIPACCLVCTIKGSTFGSSGFSNSESEKVTLYDDSGAVVDQHCYSLGIPPGYSEERVEDSSSNDFNTWKMSLCPNGTPGQQNSISLPIEEVDFHAIVINEIMSDPLAGDPEWFEIFNRSPEGINLNGWMFSDSDTTKRIHFCLNNDYLDPEAYAVISEDSSIISQMDTSNRLFVPPVWSSLNNSSDIIYLYDPSGKWIDQVAYESSWGSIPNASLERISPESGSSDSTSWYSCTSPAGMTPGEANSVYAPFMPVQSRITAAPDPFSPDGDGFEEVTLISYQIPAATASVRLQIYDLFGRLIRTLMGGTSSGSQAQILWDGKDENGKIASIGVYIVYMLSLNAQQAVLSEARTTVVLANRL